MPRLRVLSYNIHKGFSASGARFLLADIKDAIRSVNADLVLLQEVVGENEWKRKAISSWQDGQFEYLAESLWPHYAYGKNSVYSHGHHGNAILSRYPILRWANINISVWRVSSRGLLHTCILDQLHIFNVHLGLFKAERNKQWELARKAIEQRVADGAPFILAGDFNDWNLKLHPTIKGALSVREALAQLQGKPARTFPAVQPLLRVDRIYFRGMELTDAGRLDHRRWRRLSDHCPLWAEFEVGFRLPPARKRIWS